MNDIDQRIRALRREFGDRLLILGHHYQTSEVLEQVDLRGDSLELARHAAASRAERIAFCGVRFMAETADILTSPDQTVFMPASTAGCPMAEMADREQAERAWDRLAAAGDASWAPVVYVNSTVEVKAFCGERNGSACTSSNASRVLRHFLERGDKILFLPDEHLAVNTMHDLGFDDGESVVYDPARPDGGLTDAQIQRARLVAWRGYCHVHTAFTTEQIREARRRFPEARVIVHPESPRDVVRAADAHGSTREIIDYVENAPPDSVIVIGTEMKLVRRLAEKHAGRVAVYALTPSVCPNMSRTNVENLCALLESWPAHQAIRVPPETAEPARSCLDRMLAL